MIERTTRRAFTGTMLVGGASALAGAAFAEGPGKSVADRNLLLAARAALKVKLIGYGAMGALQQIGLISGPALAGAAIPGLDGENAATFWRYFLRSAQIMAGAAEGDAPVIGFFNPMLGYWWVTRWATVSGRLQIADSKFVSDSEFALQSGRMRSELPEWLIGLDKRSLLQNLRLAFRDAQAHFNAIFALQGHTSARAFAGLTEPADARQDMIARMAVVTDKVTGLLRNQPVQRLMAALETAMSRDPMVPTGLNLSPEAQQTFGMMAGVPATLRSNMGLVGVVPHQTIALLVLASVQTGRFFTVAAISTAGNAPRIERLTLMDIAGKGA